MSLHGFVHRWWRGEAGAPGTALSVVTAPAEAAFRAGVRARAEAYDRGWRRVERVPVPVVSVGNLAVGGAGKTPFAAWVAARLHGRRRRPAIVLRGYGGDEVLLHRELNPAVPVFPARKRVEGARAAIAAGCASVVLDDGFQHRALARDLDVVLIAAETWEATPRLLPRGPWREPRRSLGRAGAVVVTRKTAPHARAEIVAGEAAAFAPGAAVCVCALRPAGLVRLDDGRPAPAGAVAERGVLAVAALADPRPFLHHLQEMAGAVEAAAFADHHPYSAADAEALLARAGDRPILMTHKDAVKLRPLLPDEAEAYVLTQEVVVESGAAALDEALRRAVGA